MAQDDLLGLGLIVVIAGGAFLLLTKNGGFNLGPDAGAEDPGFVEGELDTSDPNFKKSCSQLCQEKLCDIHAAKYCSACSKCPVTGATSSQCSSLCKASNCVEYRSRCNGNCSNCMTSRNCAACRKGYEHRGPGCTCYLKSGATPQTYVGPCPAGYELRPQTNNPSEMGCYPINSSFAHAYTGRVTFNESAPSNSPNSIPMSKYKPAPVVPKPSMRGRLLY